MSFQQIVASLPLLFSNGYPTSLEKITEPQLEKFICFMIQCSLGQLDLQSEKEYDKPEWWPEDVTFSIPIVKPKNFQGNWFEKLKEIVKICYQYHSSVFLLKFCNDLASIEPASLRFINNCSSTTSLYNRTNGKLLVTFRNENMSYDQPQRNRKCLLLKNSRPDSNSDKTQEKQMVEPPPFDIYLCDYCDAEFYSFEAIQEHEKLCAADNDVIICDSPSLEGKSELTENSTEQQISFLSDLGLLSSTKNGLIYNKKKTQENEKEKNVDSSPFEELKRLPRRNRGTYALSRCSAIPLSSPAGQLMIKTSKILMTEEYLLERLDRIERFCHTSILAPGVPRPKFMSRKFNLPHAQCTFKKPLEYSTRMYTFPRRQFLSSYRIESFNFLNSLLLKRCQLLTISLRKYSEEQLRNKAEKIRKRAKQRLPSGQSLQQQNIIDTINLCSSDEDESSLNNKTSLNTIQTCSSSKNIYLETANNITLNKANKNEDRLNLENTYEGNFLMSQSPKPLQPSVFLFSNYSAEITNSHYFLNSKNILQTPEKSSHTTNFKNQENLENNMHLSSDNISLGTALSDNSNNNNNKSDCNTSSTRVLQFMSTFRDSEVTISKINSPGQILIDLTM